MERKDHPALNINKKRIMIKATIFAMFIVSTTLCVAVLIMKIKVG